MSVSVSPTILGVEMPPPSSSEPRPDFLLIGAQKAGTTSLFFDLRNQPGVFIPDDKELRVLTESDPDQIFRSYKTYFHGAPAESTRGDCSTDYAKRTVYPDVVPNAVACLAPPLKIIYLLRDPIDRLLSHFHHRTNAEDASLPVGEAIDKWGDLIDNSRYAFQLEPWIEAYGKDAIKVVFFEDFKQNRLGVVEECCRFLGVDCHPESVNDKVFNASDGKPRRSSLVGAISGHPVYQKLVRPLAPLRLRLWVVRIVSRKAAPRQRSVNPALEQRLITALEKDVKQLNEWFLVPQSWRDRYLVRAGAH